MGLLAVPGSAIFPEKPCHDTNKLVKCTQKQHLSFGVNRNLFSDKSNTIYTDHGKYYCF